MERGQRGRSRAVTHSLCGFGLGLGGQRSAPEPPVTAALSEQVHDRRTCWCLHRASIINPLCFFDLRQGGGYAAPPPPSFR